MKQFGTILLFELKYYFKNKIFVGVTIFLMAAIVIVMFFPRFLSLFEKMPETDEKRPTLLLCAEGENAESIVEAFTASFSNYEVLSMDFDIDKLQEQISSGEAECAFVLDDLTSYTYYVNNLTMYDENTYQADQILQNLYRMNTMIQEGISPDQAEQILSFQIEHKVESLGKDQMENFFYTYIMIFALYTVILLYGQMVATNVATEKSSRAMEVLITSAKPTSMMFGKVIASCMAGFLQILCVFGAAILSFRLNEAYWDENSIIRSFFDMPMDLLLYMLLFFVLGFLIYAFLYGAIGSTASKLEDINTSVMPITLLFIFAFLVVVFSMTNGNVDNLLMKICSYVPFTSPMAMFTRIAMSTVPWYEVLISVAILIVSVFGIGILSAKIYRVGVLLYGTTPKIGSILKSVWEA